VADGSRERAQERSLIKAPSGIKGLDEVTEGGLPRGRSTLVTGAAGCGKTLLGMEFLVRGARDYGEPGVFMAFEENARELTQNVRSLGFDLDEMGRRGQILIDAVEIDRSEIEESGEYDLEALFVRLNHAIDSIGAKRVVIDTVEVLFGSLSENTLRSELRRLFRWLTHKGVTAVITAERGAGTLTRHGLEEYISDCVILLDHRVSEQVLTRRLRVVKYRGSSHGTNEYPFVIDSKGFTVLPITSLGLNHSVSDERVSSGIPRLDAMLGGLGYYRGSSVLISGTAGAGKSSLAAHFVAAACSRGERALYLALEESPSQIQRNMRSIGIDLERWSQRGLLHFHAARPTVCGLEMHLGIIQRLLTEIAPKAVVVDPLTNLTAVASGAEVKSALTRLIDCLKTQEITALFTSLTAGGGEAEQSEVGISSLMDTWLLLRNLEHNGERNRGLYILKSRGMTHSNQIREFILTDRGVDLVDVYAGPAGVLCGSSRLIQEARDGAEARRRQAEIERLARELEHKRAAHAARAAAEREEFAVQEQELVRQIAELRLHDASLTESFSSVARLRSANGDHAEPEEPRRTKGEAHAERRHG
jgi:circadian clock protein KaiC